MAHDAFMAFKTVSSGSYFGYAFIHDTSGPSDVLRVYGEVDLASAPELERTIADILASSTKPLVLDLEPTAYIDSTTLGVVIRVHNRVKDRFSIALPESGPIRKLFEVTSLTSLVTSPPVTTPLSSRA